MRAAKLLFLSLLSLAFAPPLHGATSLLWSQAKVTGAVVPVYLPPESKPALILRVDKLYSDYERRGFFRIGILPLAVAEGVKLEFAQPRSAQQALAHMHKLLETSAGKRRVELRGVSFLCDSEASLRLQAKRVRLADNGQWQLLDGVSIQTPSNTVQTARASLQITGARAGELVWHSAGVTNCLQLY